MLSTKRSFLDDYDRKLRRKSVSGHFCSKINHSFQRCVKLVEQTLLQERLCHENADLEPPNKDFAIVALDLLSGLAEGMGKLIELGLRKLKKKIILRT